MITPLSTWTTGDSGVVQDWMFNRNFSVFAENPSLSQLRGQVGYATSACNEFGIGGTLRVFDDTRIVDSFGPITWRPINQVSTYWHHKYMHQSASSGDVGAQEDAWNFTTGISFYPGHNARSTNVSGQRWMPLATVANNGSFLVDASNWY
jgi:hypothetical protein